jgi:hypothetical protein
MSEKKAAPLTQEVIDGKTVYTMCGVQGCCPTATVEENFILIKDDNGGSVKLNFNEFEALKLIALK